MGFINNFSAAWEELQVWIPDKDISDANQQLIECRLALIYTHISHTALYRSILHEIHIFQNKSFY